MTARRPGGVSGPAVLRAVEQGGDPLGAERAAYYRFVASMIELGERIPAGAEISVGILLRRSIQEIRVFFAEHDSAQVREPVEHLFRHLTTWLEHTEAAACHAKRCDDLLRYLTNLLGEARRPDR